MVTELQVGMTYEITYESNPGPNVFLSTVQRYAIVQQHDQATSTIVLQMIHEPDDQAKYLFSSIQEAGAITVTEKA